MGKKYKRVYITLYCIEQFLILPSRITGCFSTIAFVFIDWIVIGITNSPIGLNMTAITVGIEISK